MNYHLLDAVYTAFGTAVICTIGTAVIVGIGWVLW